MPLPTCMTPGKPPGGFFQRLSQPSAQRRPGFNRVTVKIPYQKCRIKISELTYIPDLYILYNVQRRKTTNYIRFLRFLNEFEYKT